MKVTYVTDKELNEMGFTKTYIANEFNDRRISRNKEHGELSIVLTSKSWITKVFTQLKAGSRNFICDSILDDGTIVFYDGTRS